MTKFRSTYVSLRVDRMRRRIIGVAEQARHRSGERGWRRRIGTQLTVPALVLAVLAGVFTALPTWSHDAKAASSTISTVTKSAVDATNGSKADSTGAVGTANPGDVIKWAVNYANNQPTPSTVNLTDVIQPGQSYVNGSLQIPAGMNPQGSSDSGSTWTAGAPPAGATGVGGTGTMHPAGTAIGPNFTAGQPITMNTVGGDGWSVEGIGNRLYTYFHHSNPTIWCQTLQSTNCPNMTTPSINLNGGLTTAMWAGSFIVGTKVYVPTLYWLTPNLQCFDAATDTSCGSLPIAPDIIPSNGNSQASIAFQPTLFSSDGIKAADGNSYVIDANGTLTCFNGSVCGHYTNLFGSGKSTCAAALGCAPLDLATYGRYVFTEMQDLAGGFDLGCFDTTTKAVCPGYPVNVPVQTPYPSPAGFGVGPLYPVLDASGSTLGACMSTYVSSTPQPLCYSITGASIPNPYPSNIGGYAGSTGGQNQGVAVGNRFYDWSHIATGGQVICLQFANSGTATPCPGFTGPIDTTVNGYTVRALANLPGCMASDGDDGKVIIFDAQTGGSCFSISQTVSMNAPSYCDGAVHTTTWGNITLPGLTGTEYTSGTYTVYDKSGAMVPGYIDTPFTGALNASLAAIPTTGNTSALTVSVNLGSVSPASAAAVNATGVQLTRSGDVYSQVCYETTVNTALCTATGAAVVDNAVAVTTNGTTTDSPTGNSSGNVTFNVTSAGGSACATPAALSCGSGNYYMITTDGQLRALTATNNIPNAASSEVPGNALGFGSLAWDATDPLAQWNAVGVTAGGTSALAIYNSSVTTGGTTTQYLRVAKYDALTGTYSWQTGNIQFGLPGGRTIVAGGVAPDGKFYFAASFSPSPVSFQLWVWDPATPNTVTAVGSIATTFTNLSNGDLAFDSLGNLDLLADDAAAGKVQIITIDHTTLAAAVAAPSATQVIASKPGPVSSAATGWQVNGIAFDTNGTLYVEQRNGAIDTQQMAIDPNTMTPLSGWVTTTAATPGPLMTRNGTDLGSCTYPSTLQAVKNIVGRSGSGDQFQIQITRNDTGTTVYGQGTTSGTTTGLQTQPAAVAGAITAKAGVTYVITETGVSGANLANYVTTWQCAADQPLTGWPLTGAGATITLANFPQPPANSPGPNVTCTFTNQVAAHLTLVKQVNGGALSATSWTLTGAGNGQTLTGATGTAAVTSQAIASGIGYNLSEAFSGASSPDAAYYVASAWSCAAGTGEAAPTVTGGDVVTVQPGTNVTCTITNTYMKFFIQKNNATGKPLNGAVFGIYPDNNGAPASTPYATAPQRPSSAGSTGLTQFGGLQPGTYWIQENQAPTGYNLLAQPVQFTISTAGTITLTNAAANPQFAVSADGKTITVADSQPMEFPLTGGTGTLWFAAGGGALLLVALVAWALIWTRRQRNETDG